MTTDREYVGVETKERTSSFDNICKEMLSTISVGLRATSDEDLSGDETVRTRLDAYSLVMCDLLSLPRLVLKCTEKHIRVEDKQVTIQEKLLVSSSRKEVEFSFHKLAKDFSFEDGQILVSERHLDFLCTTGDKRGTDILCSEIFEMIKKVIRSAEAKCIGGYPELFAPRFFVKRTPVIRYLAIGFGTYYFCPEYMPITDIHPLEEWLDEKETTISPFISMQKSCKRKSYQQYQTEKKRSNKKL